MRSTVTIGNISDGVDYMMELYNLRRAYFDLDNNFANYRYTAEIVLQDKVGEVTVNMQKEIDYWKLAWENDNKWYDTFWFGLLTGVITIVALTFAVN